MHDSIESHCIQSGRVWHQVRVAKEEKPRDAWVVPGVRNTTTMLLTILILHKIVAITKCVNMHTTLNRRDNTDGRRKFGKKNAMIGPGIEAPRAA